MQIDLPALEIYILLKCSQSSLSRTNVSQLKRVRREGKERTKEAIQALIDRNLITQREFPKLGTHKTPVFYEITDKGRLWVKNYSAFLSK